MLARSARGTPIRTACFRAAALLCAHGALSACAGSGTRPGGPFPQLQQFEGREIHAVTLTGDLQTVPRDSLMRVIATRPSRCKTLFLPVCLPLVSRQEQHRLDMQVLGRDVVRIDLVFRDNGYYGTRVVPTVDEVPGDEVDVRFTVFPGDRVTLRGLAISGAEGVIDTARLLRRIPLKPGEPFRRNDFLASVDSTRNALLDAGHAYAQVLRNYQIDTIADVADVNLEAAPGPLVTVDTILFDGLDRIRERTARRQLTFREGDSLRSRDLIRSQRNLYEVELVRYATVEVAPESLQVTPDSAELAADSIGSTVLVRIAEAPKYAVDASLGYGTLDCFRGGIQHTDRNFLGAARRLTLTATVAKVGVGGALDAGLDRSILCRAFELDSLSDPVDTVIAGALNYRLAADFLQPRLFGTRNSVTLTAYAEQISELGLYLRKDRGGQLGLVRDLGPGTVFSTTYTVERGSTNAHDIFFCVVYEVCTPANIDTLRSPRWSNSLSAGVVRSRVRLDPFPTGGYQFRVGSDLASTWLGSEDRYLRAQGDGSIYQPIGNGLVLQFRLMGGTFLEGLLDSSSGFIPPQKLFYGGGATTVRGFRRNELGPVVYTMRQGTDSVEIGGVRQPEADTVLSATGGRKIVVGTVELTAPMRVMGYQVRLAGFVDAGRVWDPADSTLISPPLRFTPGVGGRIATPVGPVRIDVAYNPYPLPRGPLYLIGPSGDIVGLLDPNFKPERGRGFLKRLTLHISIGQTF
ncbi:MAG TPA: BamA/TamA family outer membrane protein [Longimicrobium sp.]